MGLPYLSCISSSGFIKNPRLICIMRDVKNKENSFINTCFQTDLSSQEQSSPYSTLSRESLYKCFSQPMLRASPLSGQAKGTFPSTMHAGTKKNWLTQLNRAAYPAEQPLEEGDYKT